MDTAPQDHDQVMPAQHHAVQFYGCDESLFTTVAGFVGEGLIAGQPAILMATQSHREGIMAALEKRYISVDRARRLGDLVVLDANEMLDMFLVAGMLIGVGGTLAGSAFGLLLIWVQNTYKIIRLAGDVYQISYLPMKLTGSDFAMIVGSTLVISFLATLSPARRAARMDPIEVLRYE